MMAVAEWTPESPRPTFSFYVPAPRSGRSPHIGRR